MALFVGLDVSQKLTSICVVDDTGRRVWRGQCASDPDQIARLISLHAGDDGVITVPQGSVLSLRVHSRKQPEGIGCAWCKTVEMEWVGSVA